MKISDSINQSRETFDGMKLLRRALLLTVILAAMAAPAASLDLNSSYNMRYFPGDTLQFEVQTDGQINAQNQLNMGGNNINNPGQISNYYGSACQDGTVIDDINDDGSFNCVDPLEDRGVEDLSATLEAGNIANQSIDMSGNSITSIGDLGGTNIVNQGNINSGAVGSGELASNAVTAGGGELDSSVAGNQINYNSGQLDVNEGPGSGLDADTLDGDHFDDRALWRKTFEIDSGTGTEYYKIGKISDGGGFEQGRFSATLYFASDNGGEETRRVEVFGAVRASDYDLNAIEYGEGQGAGNLVDLVVTETSGTGTDGHNEYYLYARAEDFSKSKIAIEYSDIWGNFDFQSGLSQSDLIGSVVADTQNPSAKASFGTIEADSVQGVSNIYSDDSGSNFFGGCPSGEYIESIGSDGSINCATDDNTDDDSDPTNELQNLSEVLERGNVANQSINMGNNDITGVDQLTIPDNSDPSGKNMLQVGDDAYFTDIDSGNTVGIQGVQDSTVASIKLGGSGPTLSGTSSGNLDMNSNSINSIGNLVGSNIVNGDNINSDAVGSGELASNAVTASGGELDSSVAGANLNYNSGALDVQDNWVDENGDTMTGDLSMESNSISLSADGTGPAIGVSNGGYYSQYNSWTTIYGASNEGSNGVRFRNHNGPGDLLRANAGGTVEVPNGNLDLGSDLEMAGSITEINGKSNTIGDDGDLFLDTDDRIEFRNGGSTYMEIGDGPNTGAITIDTSGNIDTSGQLSVGSTNCGSNQFIDGDGNCVTDDTGTDDQTLSEVLDEGNSAGSYNINMNSNRINNVGSNNINIGDGEGNIDMNGQRILDGGLTQVSRIGVGDSFSNADTEVGSESIYVKGDVSVDGDIVGAGADVAELINNESEMDSGTVVKLSNNMSVDKSDEPRDTEVAGVVSRDPSMVMAKKRDGVPIAMTGTVPVKFSAENGGVETGDFLTTASKEGYAMKCEDISQCQGAIIGKAMQSQDKTGEVKMLISRG